MLVRHWSEIMLLICMQKGNIYIITEMFFSPCYLNRSSSLDSFPPKTIDHTSQAAARVLRIGSRTDFMLGGILHPAINWAERESNVDADEMAKIKTAFVGNLPANANEEYLKKLFGHFGEVIRVAVSRKGQYPVGFIHFGSRSELDNAIKEMDGKTVSGPNRGPSFKIQVSVARPAVENDNKRSREEVKTRRSNVSGGKPDYSHGRYGHDSVERQTKAPRLSNRVADVTDPYEAALNSLPSAVNELLLRILRLGIGSAYDVSNLLEMFLFIFVFCGYRASSSCIFLPRLTSTA
uniref:RRM domain-containing protein n=1 Tax=Aegilops tauschii subsp. strangulata TaxID=200361 RepID=A0A453JWN6_AEGTS